MDPRFPDALRRFMLEQPEGPTTRVLMLAAGAVFLITVVELVRRGRLGEEHTPLWVAAGGVMLLGVWFDAVRVLARATGAWTPSSALFFLATVFLVFICLSFAVRLSTLSRRVRMPAQELALLRADHEAAVSGPEDERGGRP